jgi:agmatinase
VPGLYTSSFTFGSRDTDLRDARYAICGVPFDSSETYRTGSRFAPTAIREASREIEAYDLLEDFDLREIQVADYGDVIVSHGDSKETMKRTAETVKEILGAGAVPCLIGGEHTISYFALHGFDKKPFYLVFDAHLDFHDEYINNKLSHACNNRRAIDLLGVENVLVVGVRSGGKEEVKDARKLGLNYIDYNDCKDIDALKIKILDAIKGKEVYISIDMDVLDPKEAPGVCNPEPLGFTFEEMVEILDVLKDIRLAGFDITEVAPIYDNHTPVVAAKLIYKVLVKCSK